MGKYSNIKTNSYEFYEWALQVPTTFAAEQTLHYTQDMKTGVRVEVDRTEPVTLQDAVIIADRMENLFRGSYSSYRFESDHNNNRTPERPTPMQIEYINKKRYNQLSYVGKKRRIRNNLCFFCGKPR